MKWMAVKLLRVVVPLVGIVAVGLYAATAHAGNGGYVEGEFSFSKINDHGLDRGFDAAMWGIGFMYDGNVVADELLNYRLEVGYRVGEREFDLDKLSDETVNGFTIDQTLGMGFFRTPMLRVFAGPSVRLNFDWYSSAGDVDIVDVAIGMGPRVGLNLHLTDTLSVTGSVAYHYMYLSENLESKGLNTTVDGPQHIVGFRIGILWRAENDVWDD